ncbi:MAG: MCE family protein [Solirubrobacterales bacterium]|nr:MCE family protein [Solirubrobacterales bacterium]MBV9916959.1 MCE family protein [Solirubrobacterales bacterium]
MKRAIAVHRNDFIAILVLLALAAAIVVYILEHQPAFTFGKSYYTVKAEFATGAAVTAGQGQSVDVAGVQVGQVGAVKLDGARAVVTMNIYKKYEPIYNNASVLLRPRTPLKDMYLSLDPGSKDAGAVPNQGTLPVANTQPDVNVEEILSSLDADTRNYLLLLLAGGAQAFHDGGASGAQPSAKAVSDLRGTFKRFAPLGRDTITFTSLLAQRTQNIRRSIHNFQEVSQALGGVDGTLTSLINSSNQNFSAISSQAANLQQALTLLPSTLQQTTQTLGKVQGFANQSTVALHRLVPFAHAFGPALAAATPLFRDTTPVIKNQLRPFSVAIQPLAKTLAPAAAKLNVATPPLTRSIKVLNSLFNTLAYQPKGSNPGYLFWGSWLAHNALSLANIQDAHGPIVRGLFMGTCQQLQLFEVQLTSTDPALKPLVDLLNAPDYKAIAATHSPYCASVLAP